METVTCGLTVFTKDNAARLWRPWTGAGKKPAPRTFQAKFKHGDLSEAEHLKASRVVHPVKLYWPKSKCFDYLYHDAETLLRNYPVQATICPYEDSSSDEDSDGEDEEIEKAQN